MGLTARSPGLSAVVDDRLTLGRRPLGRAHILPSSGRPLTGGALEEDALFGLFHNPAGYCPNNSTGVSCPVGLGVKATDAAAEVEPVA